MTKAPHILVVDDHREIRDLISRALTKEGFSVSVAGDGKAMPKVLADHRIDLVLLDLMLPGEGGLALCRAVRSESDIPIIMVTAKGEEIDRVIGLEMGADDYLPKPFESRELIARINAVLRRSRMEPPASRLQASVYRFDRWTLNVEARELIGEGGVSVPLSTGEFELLGEMEAMLQATLEFARDQAKDEPRRRRMSRRYWRASSTIWRMPACRWLSFPPSRSSSTASQQRCVARSPT